MSRDEPRGTLLREAPSPAPPRARHTEASAPNVHGKPREPHPALGGAARAGAGSDRFQRPRLQQPVLPHVLVRRPGARHPGHVRLWRHSHRVGTGSAERVAGVHHRRLRDAGPCERGHGPGDLGQRLRDADRAARRRRHVAHRVGRRRSEPARQPGRLHGQLRPDRLRDDGCAGHHRHEPQSDDVGGDRFDSARRHQGDRGRGAGAHRPGIDRHARRDGPLHLHAGPGPQSLFRLDHEPGLHVVAHRSTRGRRVRPRLPWLGRQRHRRKSAASADRGYLRAGGRRSGRSDRRLFLPPARRGDR